MSTRTWRSAAAAAIVAAAAMGTAGPAIAQAATPGPAPTTTAPAAPGSINLEGAPARGAADSRATLVTFTDFGNPACGSTAVILQGLVEQFKDGVRIVFKHSLPPNDPHRLLPHEAARAAEEQGQFWPMHDLLLGNQGRQTREDVLGMAAQLHLDLPKFTAALDSGKYREAIERDRKEAEAFGVRNQPVWFLNGTRLNGPVTLAVLGARVQAILAVGSK